MSEFVDLTGKKFNRWTVLMRVENLNGQTRWLCECSCEKKTQKIVIGGALKNNSSKSCGCLPKKPKKHNVENRRIINIHSVMKQRCYNENDPNYCNYGERGIKICDEWLNKENGLQKFHDWSIHNGYADDLSIDRIDYNGNYEPSNCRWATREEQQNNTRFNVLVEINGSVKTIAQWSKELDLSYDLLYRRYRQGKQGEELVKKSKRAEKQSGVQGIRWNKNFEKWIVADKNKYIGYYEKLDDAIAAKENYHLNN